MSVLVTGASGTLGSEVCKLLIADKKTVVAMGRDRSRLLANCPSTILTTGDICDVYRLVDICRRQLITEVVHCAANKHVGVCEERPAMAIRTNVIGTANMLSAMQECQITRGVFISSDKATDDTVYGGTKLLGERLVSEVAQTRGWRLNSVRPGNIIGSAGSVVDIWALASQRQEPITLDTYNGGAAERFMMLPSQAAELVVETLYSDWCGTTIAQRMPVINMRTLAAVVAPGSLHRERLLPKRWLHQTVVASHEWAYLTPDQGHRFVIDRDREPSVVEGEYTTRGLAALSPADTRAFYQMCHTEPKDKLPENLDHRICS